MSLVGRDTHNFMGACFHAMREFAWTLSDSTSVLVSRKRMEDIYNNPERIEQEHYEDIFDWSKWGVNNQQFYTFIREQSREFPEQFPEEFPKQFRRLSEVIIEKQKPYYPKNAKPGPRIRIRAMQLQQRP
jgi:hypothetical protein